MNVPVNVPANAPENARRRRRRAVRKAHAPIRAIPRAALPLIKTSTVSSRPPTDVVGPDEEPLAERHRQRHPHRAAPGDKQPGLDPDDNATKLLNEWKSEGHLKKDPKPSLYRYRMTPRGGRPTTGVIGVLGIRPPGDDVLPHEQTTPEDETVPPRAAPRATSAQPLADLGTLAHRGAGRALCAPDTDRSAKRRPTTQAYSDELGGRTTPLSTVEATRPGGRREPGGPGRRAPPLPDGPRRYQRRADARRTTASAGPYDLVMALVVELEESGLDVGPIHRVLSGVPDQRRPARGRRDTGSMWWTPVHPIRPLCPPSPPREPSQWSPQTPSGS